MSGTARMTPSRPVLRWHGGKWLLAPWIIGHWPVGEPRDQDFGFCGVQPTEGTPYCGYHARIAHSAGQPA